MTEWLDEAGVPSDPAKRAVSNTETGAPELRIAMVGAGWAAEQHCASVSALPGARLVAVADVKFDRARALSRRTDTVAYDDYDRLLRSEDIDAVVIATPPGQHRGPAVAALDRDLGVFIEKPIARTLEDGQAIVRAAEHGGRVCAVGYQWRALDLLGRVKDQMRGEAVALLVSQGVGITQAREWFYDPHQSGRLISERASHHIDLQRAVAGDVTEVHAARGRVPLSRWPGQRGPVEDVVSLTLTFETGALGAVHVAWTPDDFPQRQHLAICSTSNSFELSLDPTFMLRSWQMHEPQFHVSAETPFLSQMRRFLDAVRTCRPDAVPCSASEGTKTLAVALAAERSVENGTSVTVGAIP